MKTLRLLAACALLGFMALPVAFAVTDCPWDSDPIVWRTSTDAGDPNDQGFIDSAVVRGSGTNGTTQRFDTSAAFTLWDKYNTGDPAAAMFAAGDSLPVFVFQLYPSKNTSLAEGGDTIAVSFQVSNDGSNWVAVNALTLDVIDPGSSLTFNHSFSTDMAGFALPAAGSFFGWGLGRIIIRSDTNGEYVGNIRYRKCHYPK